MKKRIKKTPTAGEAKTDPLHNSTTPASVAELTLPAPMDLAKLAATLGPTHDSVSAMKRAMEFYIESVLFLRECRWRGDSLIMSFGSEVRKHEVEGRCRQQAYESLWGETLEFRPSESSDPARQHLAKLGFPWKNARTLLDNIKKYPQLHPIAVFERRNDREKYYLISKHLLDIIAFQKKWRRAASKRKAVATRDAASKTKSPKNTGR
ncbi:MAG TPA: hypothetical protein VGR14_04060 [Verrucomicrobiae bacterium]|jgi:hypothetical protein|nr:hypothetical protein [Verrucomicrobiae bacterium]